MGYLSDFSLYAQSIHILPYIKKPALRKVIITDTDMFYL
jgi:hypothetical protein